MIRICTLDEYFTDVYEPRKLIDASAGCRSKYRRHIKWLSESLGRDALVSDLNEANIAKLMRERLNAARTAATVNHLRSQLVALGRFAALRGSLDCAPDVMKLREPKRTPTAWTKEQIAALFRSCVQQPGHVAGHIPAWRWWIALHSVLWDSGARIGAVLQITADQIDRERCTLTILAEQQKQAADQVFSLHPDTLLALDSIDYLDRKKVFAWSKHRQTIWNHYRQILKRAGLPHGRRDMFHKMRRSVASWFEFGGGDATKLLGHSSRKITLGYLDPTITGERQAANVLFRPINSCVKPQNEL